MITAIAIEDDRISLEHLKTAVASLPQLELKADFDNVPDALGYLQREGRVDLVLCDIELPAISGLEAADLLRKHYDELVYITGHGKYALSAYRKQVKAFLVKPVVAADLLATVGNLFDLSSGPQPMEIRLGKLWIYTAEDRTYHPVFPDQVVKLIHGNNNVAIYLKERAKALVVRLTIEKAMTVLRPVGLFMQVNPGTIVNMDEVTGATPRQVTVRSREYDVTPQFLPDYNRFLDRHQFGKGNKIR